MSAAFEHNHKDRSGNLYACLRLKTQSSQGVLAACRAIQWWSQRHGCSQVSGSCITMWAHGAVREVVCSRCVSCFFEAFMASAMRYAASWDMLICRRQEHYNDHVPDRERYFGCNLSDEVMNALALQRHSGVR